MKDGQEAGEMLLDIEARIGEMLPDRDEGGWKKPSSSITGKHEKAKPPEGMTVKRVQSARDIAKHPDIVEKVKAQARENEAT